MASLLVTLLLLPRPALSGPEAIADGAEGLFRVHYTLTGADAPVHGALDQSPANGLPDDVDAVLAGVVEMHARFIQAMGMRPPLLDGGEGGDGRVDLYLRRLDGPRGSAHPEPVGATPATSCWIEIDPRSALQGLDRLAAVAAHEAHHAVEYAYSATLPTWIYEATATWVESTFPGLSDERDAHLAAILAHPEVPLDRVDGVHEYDEMAFAEFVASVSGVLDFPTLDERWRRMAEAGDVFAGLEGPPEEVLYAFAGWLGGHACPPPFPYTDCLTQHPLGRVGIGRVPSENLINLPPLALAFVNVPIGDHPVIAELTDAEAVYFGAERVPGAAAALGRGGLLLPAIPPASLLFLARGATDRRTVTLALREQVSPTDAGSDPGATGAGCGCHAIGRPGWEGRGGPLWLVVAAAFSLARRRRHPAG